MMVTEQIPRPDRYAFLKQFQRHRKSDPTKKLPPQDFSQIPAYEPEDFEGLGKPGKL